MIVQTRLEHQQNPPKIFPMSFKYQTIFNIFFQNISIGGDGSILSHDCSDRATSMLLPKCIDICNTKMNFMHFLKNNEDGERRSQNEIQTLTNEPDCTTN